MPHTSALSHNTAPFPVAFARCTQYTPDAVQHAVERVLDAIHLKKLLSRGSRVLVKPNLLRAHALTCTHPTVVRALCACLLDLGIQLRVADSPGFGNAPSVARFIGLEDALSPLGLRVENLHDPVPIPLHFHEHKKRTWGIARLALESDAIISLPRVKAHSQMCLTLAVKNMFGCICGLRKALAHAVQGHTYDEFCHGILQMYAALPPTAALADGITAMHITGPSGGKAFELGCIGASPNAMSLDTGLYTLLGAKAENVPLWNAAQQARQKTGQKTWPQACAENIHYPLLHPNDIAPQNFILPRTLKHVSFQPHRLLQSLLKRIWTQIKTR